jgi:gluconolactonase
MAGTAKVTRLAENLAFAEGPAFLDDGRVIFTEVAGSRLGCWTADSGAEELMYTGGGPNAVAVCSDGSLVITQNGGRVTEGRRVEDECPPSLQYVPSDLSEVRVLVTEIDGVQLAAPNDLAFGPDGRLYFTDPGGDFHPDHVEPGRLFAVNPDGTGEVLHETGPTFPNGIAVDRDGSVIWVESSTGDIKRLRGAEIEHIHTLKPETPPDGFAIAANGDLYIATLISKGVTIISSEGDVKGHIDLGLMPTNCAFRGSTLYVSDAGLSSGSDSNQPHTGGLFAVELADAEGLPLFPGTVVEPDA